MSGDRAASSGTPDNAASQLDTIVYRYLLSKGYENTTASLLQEGKTKSLAELESDYVNKPVKEGFEVSIPNWILFDQALEALDDDGLDSSNEGNDNDQVVAKKKKQSTLYEAAYRSLRNWLDNSIDRYKRELQPILYPIFVHLYLELVNKGFSTQAKRFFKTFSSDHRLEHGEDFASLSAISEPAHLQESELAQRFKSTKYGVRLSRYGFELLLDYLQSAKLIIILGILNQCFAIQINYNSESNETSDLGLVGVLPSEIQQLNKEPCLLGLPNLDMRILNEMERKLELSIAQLQHPGTDISSEKSGVPGGHAPENPQQVLETVRSLKNEPPSPNVPQVPLPTKRLADLDIFMKQLEDASRCVPLSETALPSVCCFTFQNTYHELTSLRTSTDLSLTAAGMEDSLIHVWSLGKKDAENQRYIGHSGAVYAVSFSHDSRYLLSAGADKTARIWSTETQMALACFRGHNYPIWDAEFGPFGSYFATASYDRTARLWSTEDLRPLRIFAGHLDDVHTVRFHPNSAYVVTGSGDCTSRMWDVTTGRCVRLFKLHSSGVYNVAVSPNGRLLATAGDDLYIHLWDLGMGKCIKSFKGHTAAIKSLSFSMDSAVLATGGCDNTVRIYDTLSGTSDNHKASGPLKTFFTKKTPILDLQFTRRNLLLAFGVFS